jgi:2-dehydro-3-deoxyphosphooctonate aldolase (KDO 8-P synthase)
MDTIKFRSYNGDFELSNNSPLTLIAGPCVIEGEDFAIDTAGALKEIFDSHGCKWIYKSSFDKANRSSKDSFRGLGIDKGLQILEKVKKTFGVPVITDIHEKEQVRDVASVVDFLQTPAFLCRQTDFITEVASAKIPVNIKKGQFLSPYEMKNVLDKAKSTGNSNIALCERGTTFGYGNLVVDMKSLTIMKGYNSPVIFDATHSVQLPGGLGISSGGERQFVSTLAKAATSIGIAGLFLECHPNPDKAPCDGPNMLNFEQLRRLLDEILKIDEIVKLNI